MSIDPNELIQEHMEKQPYGCKCEECGGNLEHKTSVDSDFDLDITVSPCETCMENAALDARTGG